MKDHKDPNYIAKLERAIAKKYGDEAIQNPRNNWDDEKEKDYETQAKLLSDKERDSEVQDDMIEVDGILMARKLFTRESTKRTCPVCSEYSFKIRDDVFMNKFDCCYNCYIKYIEGREDRWKTGWRPSK